MGPKIMSSSTECYRGRFYLEGILRAIPPGPVYLVLITLSQFSALWQNNEGQANSNTPLYCQSGIKVLWLEQLSWGIVGLCSTIDMVYYFGQVTLLL